MALIPDYLKRLFNRSREVLATASESAIRDQWTSMGSLTDAPGAEDEAYRSSASLLDIGALLRAERQEPSFHVLGPATNSDGSAISELPPVNTPSIKGKGGTTLPTMFTTATPDTGSAMTNTDRSTANTDLTTLRTTSGTKATVSVYSRVHPELAAAEDAYIRIALTNPTVIALDRATGTVDVEGSAVIQQWLRQNDYIGGGQAKGAYSGYNPNFTQRALLEAWSRELREFGSAMGEVVLDQGRLPTRIQPVGTRDLKWYPSSNARYAIPAQTVGGEDLILDFPAIIYVALDQSLYQPDSDSPMESALQPVLFGIQLLNDIRRVIRMHLHPRTTISVSAKDLQALIPPEVQTDQTKTLEFYNSFIQQVASAIDGLAPEDALVTLDTMKVAILDRGNSSLSTEYQQLRQMSDEKTSAGAKTLPGVIGRGSSTTNASTESMIFVKQVEGALQKPLNDLMSRVCTLILRMLGHDSVVQYKLTPIDLRPEVELMAFRGQEQALVLEQLSLGFITDEEASIRLNGRLPTGNIQTPLSGSGFYEKHTDPTDTTNPYSGSAAGGSPGQDGGGGSQNEALSKTPTTKKAGSNKGVTQ